MGEFKLINAYNNLNEIGLDRNSKKKIFFGEMFRNNTCFNTEYSGVIRFTIIQTIITTLVSLETYNMLVRRLRLKYKFSYKNYITKRLIFVRLISYQNL